MGVSGYKINVLTHLRSMQDNPLEQSRMASHIFKFQPLGLGAALVNGLAQVLFDRVIPKGLPSLIVGDDEVASEIDKWCRKFVMIQSMNGFAEEKQWTDTSTKMWLDDFRDFFYDLEDVLDETCTKILEDRVRASNDSAPEPNLLVDAIKQKLRNLITNLRTVSDSGVMSERLNELCERITSYDLIKGTVKSNTGGVWQRPASTCVQPGSAIYGRDDDVKSIQIDDK